MIPLYDTIPRRRFPLVTLLLVAANVAGFVFEIALGERLEDFLFDHAFVPAVFFNWTSAGYGPALDPARFAPLITSMFLHAGVAHIVGNLLFLWIFGDNVEDRFGRIGYLVAYLGCGVSATLAHALAAPASGVPMIGASGAIAGVLGAYAVLYPRSRVVAFVPLFIVIPLFLEVRAMVFLGLWFLLQLASGWASLGGAEGGVAWWAHAGGFVVGLLLGAARRVADRAA